MFVECHSIAQAACARVCGRDESDDVFAHDFDRFEWEFFSFRRDEGESIVSGVVNGFGVQYHGRNRGIELDIDGPFVACFFDSVLERMDGFPVYAVDHDPFHDVADIFAVEPGHGCGEVYAVAVFELVHGRGHDVAAVFVQGHFQLGKGYERMVRRVELVIVEVGTDLIAEAKDVVFLSGDGFGVRVDVRDELAHFLFVPFFAFFVLMVGFALRPDEGGHGVCFFLFVGQFFACFQVGNDAVVGVRAFVHGVDAGSSDSRCRADEFVFRQRGGLFFAELYQSAGRARDRGFSPGAVGAFGQGYDGAAVVAVFVGTYAAFEHELVFVVFIGGDDRVCRPSDGEGLAVRGQVVPVGERGFGGGCMAGESCGRD